MSNPFPLAIILIFLCTPFLAADFFELALPSMSREVEELQRSSRQRPLDCTIPLNISWGAHIPELDVAEGSPTTTGRSGSACNEPNVGIPGVRDIKGVCIDTPYVQSA